jgi:uncharacterized heparinase superfamily protein
MFEKAEPEHLTFEEKDGLVTYEGYHKGYETQLPQPVRHTRRLIHSLDDGRLEIVDVLSGSGTHELKWSFHLHPLIAAELCGERTIRLNAPEGQWTLTWTGDDLDSSIDSTWFSPSYGVRVPATALRLRRAGVEIAQNRWTFTLVRAA